MWLDKTPPPIVPVENPGYCQFSSRCLRSISAPTLIYFNSPPPPPGLLIPSFHSAKLQLSSSASSYRICAENHFLFTFYCLQSFSPKSNGEKVKRVDSKHSLIITTCQDVTPATVKIEIHRKFRVAVADMLDRFALL